MFSRGKLSREDSSESMYVCTSQRYFSLCDKMSPEYAREVSPLLQFLLLNFSEGISEKVLHRHTTASLSATINSAIRLVLVQVVIFSGSIFQQFELWSPQHIIRNGRVLGQQSEQKSWNAVLCKSNMVHLFCGYQFHFFRLRRNLVQITYTDFIKTMASVLCLALNLNDMDCFLLYQITGLITTFILVGSASCLLKRKTKMPLQNI